MSRDRTPLTGKIVLLFIVVFLMSGDWLKPLWVASIILSAGWLFELGLFMGFGAWGACLHLLPFFIGAVAATFVAAALYRRLSDKRISEQYTFWKKRQ